MTTFRRTSLAWRLVLPIPITIAAVVAAVWLIVPQIITRNVVNDAVLTSEQTVGQFKIVRTYYTENVLNKAAKTGLLKPSSDHKTNDKAIPLPATMIQDLSALLADKDTTISLYSKYPWPNRKDRQLDAFQQQAWDYLTANPKSVFTREETRNGRPVVRVAVADTMAVQGCVNCHNSDPQSPKTDWKLGDVRGVLEVASVIDSQLAHGMTLSHYIVLATLLVGLLLAAITILMARRVTTPLGRITEVLLTLAGGSRAVEIPFTDRGDEVGDAARAANTFRENLVRMEKMEAEQREAHARAAADRNAAMHKLAETFEATVGGIIEAVSSASNELEAAAGTLTETAETTQKLSTAVASASEEASVNVQAVASASEQMTSSVKEIGRQVEDASRIAQEAVKQAEETDQHINELSKAAERIGDVVKLITSVAEQTNLLALNATIEAARAGEAGRGFAVVAQEVKALAAQTAKATEEIGAQISGMQTATRESVAAIEAIGGTIDRISKIASTISMAVEQQGAATQEVSRNVAEAARGTTLVANNITEVNRGAHETGSASTQVLSSAQSLSTESNRLKLEVQKFLETVRAA